MLYFFPAGALRVEECVKLCAVVWVLQVAELMGYNVINALLWRFDQIGVERYRTVAREAPPIASAFALSKLLVLNRQSGQPWASNDPGFH